MKNPKHEKWSIQSAIQTLWDLQPLRYARNQPLDFVDPSRQFVPLLVGAAAALVAGFGYGYKAVMVKYEENSKEVHILNMLEC